MAAADADAAEVERLYELGERLSSAKDKSEHAADYEAIIAAVKGQSVKAKQLAAQLIPRFFRSFPALATRAMSAMFDLVEMEELAIRIQAIRGFPLLGKDTEFVSKIADILGQLLTSEENVERDAVHKALMSLTRQDVKNSLQPLFKHVESGSEIREKIICFLRDKVFPLKAELLKPQAEMERFITDLIKKSVQDVTGSEFELFMGFLRSLSIFGDSAPRESFQELIEIIQAQADLDSQFNVSDIDHIERWISCMYMALPIFMRGASSTKFLNYFVKQIVPAFEKIPEEKKLDLLKTIAASSPYAAAQDSRQLLPSVVQLLKKYMPGKKVEYINHNYVECLLYTFHHLAHKTPNTTNSLCGYKIVTGQPSDRLGEDFSEHYKDFTERMDGSSNNFAGNLQGSPGQMDNNHLMFNMHSPMNASDQAMQMTPPLSMIPATSHFQVPMPQMTGAYQQAMFGGQFHGHFPASPQFVSQGYSGGNDQGQQQPSQEAIPGNANEDEVEEVPASQVPQPQGKKKGACHRGPGYEVEEDRVLVSGWLNISKDAATGTNQDKVAFYKRLRQYYIDNCATQNQRSLNSIQQRWSTIQTRVSRFCSILRLIERSNQSGKSYQDMVNEAIKEFQKTEPWHYGHCWEMLKDEPKWNEKVLEILQQNKGKSKQDASPTDTPTESAEEVSSLPARPEGRDSVKKRRATRFGDTSSSSVAVDMLKKMNDRGQEMDEIDAKHKAELMSLERAKFELQQKQWQAKLDMMFECSRLDREVTREQIKVQREGIEAQVKVQMQALEVERMKNDTQIMFTDATKLASGLREWVLKRQMEIMIRDGVHSNAGDSGNNDSRG